MHTPVCILRLFTLFWFSLFHTHSHRSHFLSILFSFFVLFFCRVFFVLSLLIPIFPIVCSLPLYFLSLPPRIFYIADTEQLSMYISFRCFRVHLSSRVRPCHFFLFFLSITGFLHFLCYCCSFRVPVPLPVVCSL
jgi:hypothetical protein